jgi:hypothetical protein
LHTVLGQLLENDGAVGTVEAGVEVETRPVSLDPASSQPVRR